jgi:hypothetical protein
MNNLIEINNNKIDINHLKNQLEKQGFKINKIIPKVDDFNITNYKNINNSLITFYNKDDKPIFIINFKNKELLDYKNKFPDNKFIDNLSFENIIIKEVWLKKFLLSIKGISFTKSHWLCLKKCFNIEILEFLSKKNFNFEYRLYHSKMDRLSEISSKDMINYLNNFKRYKKIEISYYNNDFFINRYKYKRDEEIIFHKKIEKYINNNSEVDIKIFELLINDVNNTLINHKDVYLLFKYVKYSFLNQGLRIDKQSLQLYCDYLDMCISLYNDNFDWYPKYLKTQHDIVQVSYKYRIDEIKESSYLIIKKSCNQFIYSDNEYSIIIPEDITDIINEGKILNHCIASYIDRILSNDSIIVFMRLNIEMDKRLITIQIKDDKVIQIKGFSNRPPTKNENDFINKYQQHLYKLTKEII